jgi:hypothetical protein
MADDINKINDEIKELKKQLGQKPFQPFDINNLQLAKNILNGLRAELRDMNSDLDYISTSFKNSVQELSKQNIFLSGAKKSLNSISGISDKILQYRKGDVDLTTKQLKNLQTRVKLDFENLNNALKYGKLSDIQKQELEDAINNQINFQTEIENTLEVQEKVNKKLGLAGVTIEGLGKAMKKIGFSNLAEPISAAIKKTKDALIQTELNNQKLKTTQDEYDKIGDKRTKIAKDLKKEIELYIQINQELSSQTSRVKNIGNALKAQLTTTNLLDFAFVELVKAFKSVDETTGNIAKKMNMSYSSALTMKKELTAAANVSGDLFITSKGMAESLIAINAELGTSVMLNEKNLATFTTLRERAGLTNDELMGMQSLVNATGGDLEKMTKEFLGHATITAKNNKVILNEKQLMTEISKVSAATTMSLGKQPGELAKAVTTAKALGMEMSKIEGIADSLLNFEDSISAEMEAELLTGRQINLERARLAAINNDIEGVAREIAEQMGSATEFSNMNRIQQESIAKAVGMNREELAKTLFIQEQTRNVSKEEAKLREQKINKLLNDGLSIEQAAEQVGKEKFEDLKNQASMQDRFNASVEKLREIFITVAEAIMPIFDIFSNILNIVGLILKPLGALINWGNSFGKTMGVIVGLLTAAGIAALVMNASLTFGVGAAIALASIGGGMALLEKNKNTSQSIGDLNSPAKGKTMVSTKEGGLFELSKNDDLIAAPGLSERLQNNSQYTTPPSNQTPITVNMEPLIKEIKMMKEILSQILIKEGTITLNGTKMGTAMAVGTYKIQ